MEYFHENPYFQYFCGQDTFVPKLNGRVIHPSLLSKRRCRLGVEYMKAFEAEVLNDVKLLNTVREWGCHSILKIKNILDPKQKIRTMKRTARKVYLQYQKTRRKTRNRMLRFTKRNIGQLELLIARAKSSTESFVISNLSKIEARLAVEKLIYEGTVAK